MLQPLPKADPIRLTPFLARARRPVQQHCIGRRRCGRVWLQAIVDDRSWLVAERESRQCAIAHHCMQFTRHRMTPIVEPRRYWFTNAARVVTMPLAARHGGQQRRANQPLGIHDLVERAQPKIVPECSDFAPGCRREKLRPPAPRRHRDNLIDAGMQPRERRKSILDQPTNAGLRPLAADVGDRRHIVDDITER